MLKIGIIGAGTISDNHINAYRGHQECEVVSIADINLALAEKKAKTYNIANAYSDYHEILNDKEIDAVSIVTPTFTHKQIIIEALAAGKHVLSEKPPALNADEVREIKAVAEKSDKCLMFGLICRFRSQIQYLKKYIEAGKMGPILYTEAVRTTRCSGLKGWFVKKSMSGGGPLIDSNIHEIDCLLYLMGYPKPKTVLGFTSDMNKDLPDKIKGRTLSYVSSDTNVYERDVETFASALVTFENGACLSIKTSSVFNGVSTGLHMEISGEKAGARMEPWNPDKTLAMIELNDENYMQEVKPTLTNVAGGDLWFKQISHFVDCCTKRAECITKIDEAEMLMEIIDAVYKSAQTGKAINF